MFGAFAFAPFRRVEIDLTDWCQIRSPSGPDLDPLPCPQLPPLRRLPPRPLQPVVERQRGVTGRRS